ncbi:response regulator transcription factor [Achromobacter sp. DH1f]|uniref:response regulator transcription factor n=1 Tax=Achromobacter sp. DH1f TaxID=1397275 RepID=UPI00046A83E8|nr:helix-turn-helix transcriptional regulator [Achromobacter sp. DH1f]
MQTPRPDLDAVLSALTPRERQIVAYVAAGRPNKVIAIDLGISLRTVESHRARIFTKLRARNAMQLACRLCAHGRSGASPVLGITREDPLAPSLAPSLPPRPGSLPWPLHQASPEFPRGRATAQSAAYQLHEPQDATAGYATRPAPSAVDTQAGGTKGGGIDVGGMDADDAASGDAEPGHFHEPN